jgi:hypothetical protein
MYPPTLSRKALDVARVVSQNAEVNPIETLRMSRSVASLGCTHPRQGRASRLASTPHRKAGTGLSRAPGFGFRGRGLFGRGLTNRATGGPPGSAHALSRVQLHP